MLENIVLVKFPIESEAYQAITELKKAAVNPSYVVSQAAVVTRSNGVLSAKDSFDVGIETTDDARLGGLVGALTGVLGGPVGMLFYGSLGALIGSTVDAKDAAKNATLLEKVAQSIGEGETALLLMAQEELDGSLDRIFEKFSTEITKFDAAEVEDEVEEAIKIQKEMEKEAKKKLRESKSEERKARHQERRDNIKQHFTDIKAKFNR